MRTGGEGDNRETVTERAFYHWASCEHDTDDLGGLHVGGVVGGKVVFGGHRALNRTYCEARDICV